MITRSAPCAQSSARERETPLYVPGVAKPVAGVTGTILHKTIRGSQHLRRTPRAIGFDVDLLERAEALGALSVRVTDSENGDTYGCTIAELRTYGFIQNQGFGRQIFLQLEYWSHNGGPSEIARRETEEATRAAQHAALPQQFGLFGGAA